jgi:hypothetical protein
MLGVPAVTWSITNGVAMVRGTSQTNKWCGTRVTLPVAGNAAKLVEISGESCLPDEVLSIEEVECNMNGLELMVVDRGWHG